MLHSQHELEITALANSGDGVGRLQDGRVVFVPYSCPQDRVIVRITKVQKNFLKGQIEKIIRASPHRETPRCSYFGDCGGCDWQHINYSQQLLWKTQNLKDILTRIGQIDNPPLLPIVESPEVFNYRNRIQVQYDKKGFSLHRKGSKQTVLIEKCDLAKEEINRDFHSLHRQIIESSKQGRVELATTPQGVKSFPADRKSQTELGFRQVNDEQNKALQDKIIHFIQNHSVDRVFDLYCGQGNWSFKIAEQFPQLPVIGIDSNPVNIERANKQAQGLSSPPQFHLGDLEDVNKVQWTRESLIIVDPPRVGCSQNLINKLIQSPPTWLVYISCHPATMSRDLLSLKAHFEIIEIQPVDMFPQTAHLECLSLLRSANKVDTEY